LNEIINAATSPVVKADEPTVNVIVTAQAPMLTRDLKLVKYFNRGDKITAYITDHDQDGYWTVRITPVDYYVPKENTLQY
jgi:hypothetical protein